MCVVVDDIRGSFEKKLIQKTKIESITNFSFSNHKHVKIPLPSTNILYWLVAMHAHNPSEAKFSIFKFYNSKKNQGNQNETKFQPYDVSNLIKNDMNLCTYIMNKSSSGLHSLISYNTLSLKPNTYWETNM